MKTTRTERERMLDELTRGAGHRREREIRARAETDVELRMLLDADAAIARAVERDRLSLTGDRTRPGSRILTKLAATPGTTAPATTGSALRPRDILTAGAILAALVLAMLFMMNIDSRHVSPIDTPAVRATAPEPEGKDASSRDRSGLPAATTRAPMRNNNTSPPARATTPPAAPDPARTRNPGREGRSPAAPLRHDGSNRDSTAPPPVFNDDKVDFEVRVEK